MRHETDSNKKNNGLEVLNFHKSLTDLAFVTNDFRRLEVSKMQVKLLRTQDAFPSLISRAFGVTLEFQTRETASDLETRCELEH